MSTQPQGWMLIFTLLFVGCSKNPGKSIRPPLGEAPKQVVPGSNKLGFQLYATLREKPGNVLISPYGASVSLGLLLGGADGSTRDQILGVVGITSKQEQQYHLAQDALRHALAGPDESPLDQLDVAAAIFVQTETDFLKSFWRLAETYGGKPQIVDFDVQPATARKIINDWAADKSRNTLGEVVAPDDITEYTRIILANAVYFKGAWQHSFDRSRTKQAPFHTSPDTTVEADMMHQTEEFGYRHADNMRVLIMPYRDEVSMVMMLPDEPNDLGALESRLSGELISKSIADAAANVVEVPIWIPRFKFENVHNLKAALQALGITAAFDPQTADLSRIDGERPSTVKAADRLFVSRMQQRATIDVDEEGTEAAAMTTTGLTTTDKGPQDPPLFRADHPFLFLIRENETGLILFIGRVVDPTQN